MGIKGKIVILFMAFLCFGVPAFSNSPGQILHLDQLQGNMKHEAVGSTGTAQPIKFGHASSGRGGGRPSVICGGHSNGGGSQPSSKQRGSATIPLYAATGAAAGAAAGTANHHRNSHQNHSGSNRHYNRVEVVTLAFALLTGVLLR